MKFAMLVMLELRAIKKTINTLYKYIIDPYDADIFILCQKQFEDDNKNIELFDRKVIYKELYDKPDPHIFFNNAITKQWSCRNWNNYSCLQIYINLYKMANIIKPYINDYDYFIFIRPDIEVLFPFPDKELFEKVDKKLYSIDANYAISHGGIGHPMYIHRDYILEFLTCSYDRIVSSTKDDDFTMFNQEAFLTHSMKKQQLEYTLFKNLNYYYTVETLQDYTTWSKPSIHPVYNVLCKYDSQVSEAYNNLKLWNEGYRWGIKDGIIMLIK